MKIAQEMRGQTQLEPIAYLPKNFRNSYSVQRQSPDLKLVDQKYEDARLMNDIQDGQVDCVKCIFYRRHPNMAVDTQ